MDDNYIQRITWDEVGAFLNSIAARIDPHDFSGVYGIPRGGCVLAAWLAHKLYLPLLSEPSPCSIIVDDICGDTGNTLKECILQAQAGQDVDECYVAVMYHKNGTLDSMIDFYYKEKEDNWIVFPWEQ